MPVIRRRTAPAQSIGQRDGGQILALFAIFLVVLIGFAALAVDFGSWLKVRRDYQNVADAAALAGAPFLTRPVDSTKRLEARQAAWVALESQLGVTVAGTPWTADTPASTPVTDATGQFRMWVSSPPIGAAAATAAKYPGASTGSTDRTIFVWVERNNDSYLSRIFGQGSRNISAWATAGLLPGKYAVITLRQQNQQPTSVSADITLNGNNTNLEVISGDVGGNWNMKLNSGSQLWLHGAGDNDANAYLVDYVSCGNSCWSLSQVSSGPNGFPANQIKPVLQLPGIIPDPNYPLPPPIVNAPTNAVIGTTQGSSVLTGDPTNPACCSKSSPGSVDIGGGRDTAPGGTSLVGGVLTCDSDSPRIGPGYYTSITVESGQCLILDPTYHHSSVTTTVPDVATPVTQVELPGVFYVNGPINVNQNAMIVGDGVSIFIRPGSGSNSNRFTVSSGGAVDLNRGISPLSLGTSLAYGAWTRDGSTPYVWNPTLLRWEYQGSALSGDPSQVGIAVYVIKRSQYSSVAADDNTSIVTISSGAALAWNGITYAPHDNVTLAGQPGHDGVGQLVSWTFTFSGGVTVKQTYAGPNDALPYLIEPTLGQ